INIRKSSVKHILPPSSFRKIIITEFTYMNYEEYNSNTPEERNEDIFIVDQIALANARALLNDDDDNDNMNWNEVEPEDFDSYSNSFQTIHDDIDGSIAKKSSSGYRAHYICSECFQQQDGHLYKRLGKGQKIVSCTERGKHCDDTSDALKHIGRWVISIAESGNNKLQERLLSLITPTLAVFNNETMEENLSEMEAEKLPSKLLVRTALRMGKVESNKLKKERSHIVTLEKASMIGEKLEREVLFSRSEIQQNISQLENLNSYESYFNALPKIICSFFQTLITVLQQQKQNVVNKKRLQRGLPSKSFNTNISHYTYTQLESIKKQKSRQVDDPTHLSIIQQSTSSASQQVLLPSEINHPRKIRRTTTNAEK
ncbi:12914_t:CDS:2, partial [Funneliformis mosseae]